MADELQDPFQSELAQRSGADSSDPFARELANRGPEQSQQPPGMLESFGHGILEGGTLGLKSNPQSFEANPFSHFAGELVGGTIPMVAAAFLPTGIGQAADVARGAQMLTRGAGLARRLLTASEAKSFPSKIGQATKLGTVYGTLSGAGHAIGEGGDLEDVGQGAAAGAVTGAALGPAFGVAPQVAGRAARWLLRIPEGAFTPTVARWTENANQIFRKMGLPMSADGSQPGETPGGEAAAYSILANVLRRANVPIEQLDTLLGRIAQSRRFNSNSYAPDATMLVDLDPALQKFAGSLMRDNPEVWKLAVDAMYGRQTGITPARTGADVLARMGIPTRERMAPPLTAPQAEKLYGTSFGAPTETTTPTLVAMGARERVGEGYRRALGIEDVDFHGHAPTADMTDEQLVQLAKKASDQKYGAMRTAGQGVDLRPTVEPILQRWEAALQGIGTSQVRAQIAKNIREVRQAINIPDEEIPSLVRGTSSPIDRLDNWKQFADNDIAKFYSGDKTHNKTIGNAIQVFKSSILEGLKDPETGQIVHPGVDYIQENNLGNLYADARGAFSSIADARRAIKTGREIGQGKAGVNEYRALEKDDASQKLVRLGMHGDYMDTTAEKGHGYDPTRYFDNPRIDEVLSEIIPRSQRANAEFSDRPQRFGRYLGNEQMMAGTAKRTYQGSPTAERMADDKAAQDLFNLTDQLRSGGVKSVLSNAAADLLQKFFGYHADTAATLGRVLFTANPDQRAHAIEMLRQYMQPGRFAYFQQVMNENARRLAVSGAATTSGQAAP